METGRQHTITGRPTEGCKLQHQAAIVVNMPVLIALALASAGYAALLPGASLVPPDPSPKEMQMHGQIHAEMKFRVECKMHRKRR